jgi:Carboxypeptidase C (cathepsin A)
MLNDVIRKSSADSYTEFAVNGTEIPDVDFDVGESYAGLLPISDKEGEESQLFFWFFPSENPAAEKEILIWLNGGVCFPAPRKMNSKTDKDSPVARRSKVCFRRTDRSSGNMAPTSPSRTHGAGTP